MATTQEMLLEQICRSPRLRIYTDRMLEILGRERAARQHFYETMAEGVKQEFINGEIIVSSPVTLRHERASSNLHLLLNSYVKWHDLGYVAHEKLLICLSRNDYEPDVCFFRKAKAAALKPDQLRFPAPDFVAEVLSETTEATDRGVKFDDYAAHGIQEYWIVDPVAEVIEQYVLSGTAYELRRKVSSGNLQSAVIEGLDLPVRAVFDEGASRDALRAMLR